MEPRVKELYAFQFGNKVKLPWLLITLDNIFFPAFPDELIGVGGMHEIKSFSVYSNRKRPSNVW